MLTKEGITDTLTAHVQNQTLSLATTVFEGPVNTAIGFYLNGITISIGQGHLKVTDKTLEMTPVTVSGSATEATVTVVGTGSLAGASIAATFSESNGGVALGVVAKMGDQLKWTVSDLWPSLLDEPPFTDLALAGGELDLTTSRGEIDFTGKGNLEYKSSTLASAALRVVYNGKTTGDSCASKLAFLAGVVVTSWSPGSLWAPLGKLNLSNSGLFFASAAPTASQLTDLVPDSEVPAVKDDFLLKKGVSFFGTLRLDEGPVKLLGHVLKNDAKLSLFANIESSRNASIVAHLAGLLTNSKFQFEGFTLEWDMQDGQYSISASTGGQFDISASQTLHFDLTGSIESDGTLSLTLAMNEWTHPFGLGNLNIEDLHVTIEGGAGAEGVTVILGGAYQFITSQNKFEFGVAGAITDFEAPSGIAARLDDQSPGQTLTLGEAIDGITTIDVSKIPTIAIIDNILQIKGLEFWAVEVDGVEINGKTYPQGFGFNGDVSILGKEIKLNVDIQEKAERFSGSAEIVESIDFGDVLKLYRSTTDTRHGPIAMLSSEIDTDHPHYLYLSAYVVFLDIIKAHAFAEATNDGFQFIFDVTAGSQGPGGVGKWAEDTEVRILANAKELEFDAKFAFDFHLENVQLNPLKVDGIELLGAIQLPKILVGSNFDINVMQRKCNLVADLHFDLLSLNLRPRLRIYIDVSEAPTTLAGLGKEVFKWVDDNLEDILTFVLRDADRFVNWAKNAFEQFGNRADEVAKYLAKQFGMGGEAVAQALKEIGYGADTIAHALVYGLKIAQNDAAQTLKAIGYDANTVFNALKNGLGVAGNDAKNIVKGIFHKRFWPWEWR